MHHFSLFDLSPIPEGRTVADARGSSVDPARHVQALRYHRNWLAEPFVAWSAR